MLLVLPNACSQGQISPESLALQTFYEFNLEALAGEIKGEHYLNIPVSVTREIQSTAIVARPIILESLRCRNSFTSFAAKYPIVVSTINYVYK